MTMGGASLIGATMPGTSGAPVTQVATSGSPFVAPMSAVTGAGAVVGVLKDLKPKDGEGGQDKMYVYKNVLDAESTMELL